MNNSESVKQMVEQLHSNRDHTGDAVFLVESQQIRAHRNVLAALSPKYKAQFYGPNPDQGEIRIPNVSADAFNEFLQFFYKESVDLTMGNIETVLDLAQQSLVDGFVEICADFLKKSITSNNVCFVYHLAILYDIETLRVDCERQIGLKTMDVFGSDNFLRCNRDVLLHILNLDTFGCTETDVFNACIAWARADCQRKGLDEKCPKHLRAALDDAIYLVRFSSMNAQEFATLHKSVEGFFTVGELAELLCITTQLKDFVPKMFGNTPRVSCQQTNDHSQLQTFNGPPAWSLECNRFENMLEKRNNIYIFNNLGLELLCDSPIRLYGFVLGVCLDRSFDDISINVAISCDKKIFSHIELKCKLYRNALAKNETIVLFETPIEQIKYFRCFRTVPDLQLNYELILKEIVKVNNIRFRLSGTWVMRLFFDKL